MKTYAMQKSDGVHVSMDLPSRVEMIIIGQTCSETPMCYAKKGGEVYAGETLKKDPFLEEWQQKLYK